MKLHEIIEANKVETNSILIENIFKYKKILLVYYKNIFSCEPVLMVTDVFNAAQYGKIVPSDEFIESIDLYLYGYNEEDKETAKETIMFNSRMLMNL